MAAVAGKNKQFPGYGYQKSDAGMLSIILVDTLKLMSSCCPGVATDIRCQPPTAAESP